MGLATVIVAVLDAFAAAPGEYEKTIKPFLQEHCVRCHGPEKQKGEFRMDTQLPNNFLDPAAKEKWGEVVNMLNGYEMPPKKEAQPKPDDVARVVDWITGQLAQAEMARRDGAVVLRRLNREEYKNTIRDLVGVNFDVSGFPLDPPAGGFDNNAKALTLSPLHMELYVDAAQKIFNRALVTGDRPPAIHWHFEPEEGEGDQHRQRLDKENNPIRHSGKNEKKDGRVIMHHASWDRPINIRDFRVPTEGEYIIRIRAGGFVPTREAVVESARKKLQKRMDEQMEKNPKGAEWHKRSFENDLKHFQTDRIYDYGRPRLKLTMDLGGQPRTVAEFDVDAPLDKMAVHEFRARFTREKAGINFEYAYPIPRVLENFWFQGHDDFARPEAHVDWVEIEGPVYDSWPPPSHKLILFDSPLAQTDERAYAREILARFMRRAFRRPVANTEVDAKLALYDAARKEKPTLQEAIQVPLVALLASPHFLYIVEPNSAATKSDAPKTRALTDHELAARLSYFLWSSMPDEPLSRLADAGKLRDPRALTAQVDRMLADPKSEAFVRNFAGQWLGLREVGANPPAEDLYPGYDRHLETSIVRESEAFFAEILRHDLSVMNFVKSDFVVINERLARHYGIGNVRGDHFRRVPAPPDAHRGGVLTQASILSITSNGTRTSPVKRGTWALKNLLGTDPGLPLANAGDIQPKVPGIGKATVRQRLEAHRQLPQCARCHDKIDPLGLALENFNAAGEWRAQEGFGYKGRIEKNDPVINASATMPDGTEFSGVEGLQEQLLKKEDLFLNCLTTKMFTYALGRELGFADQPAVKSTVAHLKQNKYTPRALLYAVVKSQAFRSK